MAAERDRLRRLRRLEVPHLHRRIPASRGQVAAIRTEGDLPGITSMALQRAEFRVCLRVPVDVPDFHCMLTGDLVTAGRCDALAVWTDDDAGVRMKIVSDLKARICLRRNIPDLDGGIGSADRYQEWPVGVEGHTRNRRPESS